MAMDGGPQYAPLQVVPLADGEIGERRPSVVV
jgi:hypothetical protein